jgi:putative tryptophan/tyrosine transport system substrate-binding protein
MKRFLDFDPATPYGISSGCSICRYGARALSALCALLFALCTSVEAQQPAKLYQIGFLTALSPPPVAQRLEAFLLGLRELGYIERKNFVVEARYAQGKLESLPDLAADLARLKVEVILSAGPASTRSAKKETATIPVVMAFDTDPVGNGFVDSLARPGGNVTGLSALSPEIGGKHLEFLKDILPKISRVAVIGSSTEPANAQERRETEVAARALGITVEHLDIKGSKDVETAFQAARKGRADAVLVLTSPFTFARRAQVVEFAARSRVPVMYWAAEFVEDGGLIAYSVSFTDLFRRAATYVDKILKGAKPAELPVEQPTKFELVINLKAAKQIGLVIPANVLARADRVIR